MQKKESRQEKIISMLYEYTVCYLESPAGKSGGLHAAGIGETLCLDRANVSRELNNLYKSGQVIKLLGKPTLYLHRPAVSKVYPNVFVPTTIPKGKNLLDYLGGEGEQQDEYASLPAQLETNDIQIGIDGSLQEAFLQASAAVMYPPHGLPILIAGNPGTGKLRFAQEVYRFSVSKSVLPESAPFVVCDCREYSDMPQMLITQLFGEGRSGDRRSRRGLLEKASGGILCLDGIQSLGISIQKRLSKLLENQSFSRIGESGVTRYSNTILIALSSDPHPSFELDSFVRSFPVHISIPDLNDRGQDELFAYISLFFREEAGNVGGAFRVSCSVLSHLLNASYPGNVNELRCSIKTICSLAFRDYMLNGTGTGQIEVSERHLPSGLLHRITPAPERIAATQAILSSFPQSFATFSSTAAPQLTLTQTAASQRQAASRNERCGLPVILAFHGDGIAEQTASFLNDVCGSGIARGISYSHAESLEDYINQLTSLAQGLDARNGILIIADMDPLCNLHESITKRTGIAAATVLESGLSTLITIGQMAMRTSENVHDFVQRSLHNQLQEGRNTYLDQIINEILAPSLTFLDPQKAVAVLLQTLDKILDDLSIKYSDEIALRFIFHCSHMFERLIRGQSLKYDHLKAFANEHTQIFSSLENRMQYPSESFGVVIPTSELAYIVEIFL